MSLKLVTPKKLWLGSGVAGLLGVVGVGCLDRPVTHQEPTTKTNFTSTVKQQSVDKVDILFMIDNSSSMGDKQTLLAAAVPDLVNRLVNPNCVDTTTGAMIAGVSKNGDCTAFAGTKSEFPPVHDMHIGVVSSSLGGLGSDACASPSPNPVTASLDRHNNDNGHLLNRGGASEAAIGDEGSSNFLAWLPMIDQNTGKPPPGGGAAALGDVSKFNGDFTNMITGVHEYGCGFEAQLESWYRFLVQPDPYDHIEIPGGRAQYVGVDATILQQRADFLRPDSLVAVIVVTDENIDAMDPLSLQGQGWAYMAGAFPANNCQGCTGTAPKPTAKCATAPNDPTCDSCFFHQGNAECTPLFYDTASDNLNVRAFHMKERFGVDPQYPVSRYVRGLSKKAVPDRDHEHFAGTPAYTGECDGSDPMGCPSDSGKPNANCVNPLYATNLPTDPSKELCALTVGPRDSSLVFYAAIAGVPHQLLQAAPGSMDCPAGTAATDCPQKSSLVDADWVKILGKDPLNYDFTGVDPHMLESSTPRAGIPGPGSADNADAINGRDYDTGGADLEYACTFTFTMPKDCTSAQFSNACDCEAGYKGPLCQAAGSTTQIKGKAYPDIQELSVARALGDQGIVSSLCPIHETDNATKTDPLFGYRPAAKAIVDRLKNALANQCLPNPLTPHSDGTVDCLILETLASGNQSACNNPGAGLSQPDPEVLAKFQEAQKATDPTGATAKLPTCQVKQLVGKDLDSTMSCAASMGAGWCYVTGPAAGTCPQAILFSPTGNPQVGSSISLQCIETSGGGTTAAGSSDAGTGGGG